VGFDDAGERICRDGTLARMGAVITSADGDGRAPLVVAGRPLELG